MPYSCYCLDVIENNKVRKNDCVQYHPLGEKNYRRNGGKMTSSLAEVQSYNEDVVSLA